MVNKKYEAPDPDSFYKAVQRVNQRHGEVFKRLADAEQREQTMKIHAFERGETVRCVRACKYVPSGGVYKVGIVNWAHATISLEGPGAPYGFYDANRFEPVMPTLPVGNSRVADAAKISPETVMKFESQDVTQDAGQVRWNEPAGFQRVESKGFTEADFGPDQEVSSPQSKSDGERTDKISRLAEIYRRYLRDLTSTRWEIEKLEALQARRVPDTYERFGRQIEVQRRKMEHIVRRLAMFQKTLIKEVAALALNPITTPFHKEAVDMILQDLGELEGIA